MFFSTRKNHFMGFQSQDAEGAAQGMSFFNLQEIIFISQSKIY